MLKSSSNETFCCCISRQKGIIFSLVLQMFIFIVTCICITVHAMDIFCYNNNTTQNYAEIIWIILVAICTALASIRGFYGLYKQDISALKSFGVFSIAATIVIALSPEWIEIISNVINDSMEDINIIFGLSLLFVLLLLIYSIYNLQKFMNKMYDDSNQMVMIGFAGTYLAASFFTWPLTLIYVCAVECCSVERRRCLHQDPWTMKQYKEGLKILIGFIIFGALPYVFYFIYLVVTRYLN